MPHFECLECKTCLHITESQAEPIGDLSPVCGSLLEPVGDLREIVGYRAIETRGSTSPSGSSGVGERIADRVGQIIARCRLEHARIRLEIESRDAHSRPAIPAFSSLGRGTGDEPVRRGRHAPPRSRAAATVARPPGFRHGVVSARTALPDESSHFAHRGRPRRDVAPSEPRG
jgi:hypothetical protein